MIIDLALFAAALSNDFVKLRLQLRVKEWSHDEYSNIRQNNSRKDRKTEARWHVIGKGKYND
jgi:hypothetical protein